MFKTTETYLSRRLHTISRAVRCSRTIQIKFRNNCILKCIGLVNSIVRERILVISLPLKLKSIIIYFFLILTMRRNVVALKDNNNINNILINLDFKV